MLGRLRRVVCLAARRHSKHFEDLQSAPGRQPNLSSEDLRHVARFKSGAPGEVGLHHPKLEHSCANLRDVVIPTTGLCSATDMPSKARPEMIDQGAGIVGVLCSGLEAEAMENAVGMDRERHSVLVPGVVGWLRGHVFGAGQKRTGAEDRTKTKESARKIKRRFEREGVAR